MNKVRGYRNMLGLNQTEMAKKLSISKNSYHLKEVGKVHFTDQEKGIIKEMLKPMFPNITIDEIFFAQ